MPEDSMRQTCTSTSAANTTIGNHLDALLPVGLGEELRRDHAGVPLVPSDSSYSSPVSSLLSSCSLSHSTRRYGSHLVRIREGERIRGDACCRGLRGLCGLGYGNCWRSNSTHGERSFWMCGAMGNRLEITLQ
jgi:hypothetical protein